MQKKKFDLTSDIVDVSVGEQVESLLPLGEVKNKDTKATGSNNILLSISINKKKRNEIKSWCAKRELRMNEAFLKGFELFKIHYDKQN